MSNCALRLLPFVTVFVVLAISGVRALPLAGEPSPDQPPVNICKTYPLLHLCLIRPILNGVLAELSYLVNSVAFVNNGPDGYYLSNEPDQSSVPLEFTPADTRPTFILQDDPLQPASHSTFNNNDEKESTIALQPSFRNQKHKRHVAGQTASAAADNLETRSLFVRPTGPRRRRPAPPAAGRQAVAIDATMAAHNFIADHRIFGHDFDRYSTSNQVAESSSSLSSSSSFLPL